MNLSKFAYVYNLHDLVGFIIALFGKIGLRYRLDNQLTKLISFHYKQIEKVTKKTIIGSFYEGTKLRINEQWSRLDGPLKFLGLYEYEMQEEISRIQKDYKKKKKYFKIKSLTYDKRDLSKYKILDEIHDNEKWLVVN